MTAPPCACRSCSRASRRRTPARWCSSTTRAAAAARSPSSRSTPRPWRPTATPRTSTWRPLPTPPPTDTKLFGDGFDVIEVGQRPGPSFTVLNDWMTFLSRGTVRTVDRRVRHAQGVHRQRRLRAHLGEAWAVDSATAVHSRRPSPRRSASSTRSSATGRSSASPRRSSTRAAMPVGPTVDIGDTLSIAAERSGRADRRRAGPRSGCRSTASSSTRTRRGARRSTARATTRWPDGRILQKKDLDALDAAGGGGAGHGSLRRVHVVEKFVVQPTADTWFVAMARGDHRAQHEPAA